MKVHDFREDDGSLVVLQPNERLWVDATGKGYRVVQHSKSLAPLQAARDRRATRLLWLGSALTVAAFALALYFTKVPHG